MIVHHQHFQVIQNKVVFQKRGQYIVNTKRNGGGENLDRYYSKRLKDYDKNYSIGLVKEKIKMVKNEYNIVEIVCKHIDNQLL